MIDDVEPLIYIIAGEPSGDLLGARLITALQEETDGHIRFAGIGGECMFNCGLVSLFDFKHIAVVGFLEVLPRIPKVLSLIRSTVVDITRCSPSVLVTIDSWGFTSRVNRIVRSLALPVAQIHYVAPMPWAWHRQYVARSVKSCVDHLMTLFPDEITYFERTGLRTTYVGHPILESGADQGNGSDFRARHKLDTATPLLCVLPGSRYNEVTNLLPILAKTVHLLACRRPSLKVVIPTISAIFPKILAETQTWRVPTIVILDNYDKYNAFSAANVAIAASGTVVLELALAGVPMVVIYKVSMLSAWILRQLGQISYVSLINRLLNRPAVPELLQEMCRPELLAAETEKLLDDTKARAEQLTSAREALTRLGYYNRGKTVPSALAAKIILNSL